MVGPDKGQTEVKRGCEVRLAGRHAAEKLQRCWGCSAGCFLEETRSSIRNLLTVQHPTCTHMHVHLPRVCNSVHSPMLSFTCFISITRWHNDQSVNESTLLRCSRAALVLGYVLQESD